MNIRTAHNYINQKVAFLGFYSLSGPFAFCSSQSVFSQHFPSTLLAVCIPCSIEFVRIDINFVYIYICVYRPTQPVDGPFDCWVGTSTVEPGKRQKSGSRKVTAQGKVKKWKKNWTRTKNNLHNRQTEITERGPNSETWPKLQLMLIERVVLAGEPSLFAFRIYYMGLKSFYFGCQENRGHFCRFYDPIAKGFLY